MAEHGLRSHPKSAVDLLVGKTPEGSASCVCGRWQVANLDNVAGRAHTNRTFLEHLRQEGVIQ